MTLATLQTDTRYLISPQLTSTNYGDTDLNRNLNHWYRMAVGWVLEFMDEWEYNAEFSTTNLVADQAEYVIPTTLLRLKRVEIKYPDASEYVTAAPADDWNISDPLGEEEVTGASEGAPVYRVGDNSLFLYPVPDANVTSGLRIEYVDDVADLSASGDLPNLPAVLHRILSCGAAHDYALAKEMYRKKEELHREIYGKPGVTGTGLKYQLESLFSRREHSTRPRITVRTESFN